MSANLTDLFESSLEKIESLAMKKVDDGNFIITQKTSGLLGFLSINSNENDDVSIKLELDLKDAIGLNGKESDIQELISKIHNSNTITPCKVYTATGSTGDTKQSISMTYIDYTGVFKEEDRSDELKEKDFIIITLSIFNEILNSIKYILTTLNSISLKIKNKNKVNTEADGHEEQ